MKPNSQLIVSEIATGLLRELEYDYRNRMTTVIDRNSSGSEIQVVATLNSTGHFCG